MNPSTYACSKCKQSLPETHFAPVRSCGSRRPVKYYCIVCEQLYKAAKTLEQKEKGYPQATAYQSRNAVRVAQYFRENHITHKQHRLELARVYKQTNKETILIHANARRKRCRESQPSWADVDRIREVYALTATKTRITGIKHHVDHIIPLNGKHVCGLHVHENLQILTKEENLSKGNKHS